MPHYVILGNWTDQGLRNVRESPKRAEAARHLAEQMGGKLSVWYTIGPHDFVGLAEAPSDEAAYQLLLQLGAQGNVRTTTLKAWPEAEASKVIAKVLQV